MPRIVSGPPRPSEFLPEILRCPATFIGAVFAVRTVGCGAADHPCQMPAIDLK